MEPKLSKRSVQTLHSIIARNKPGYVVVNGTRVRVKPKDITDEKTGGILPLAALIPLIIGGIGAAGGIAGGTAQIVNAANTRKHQLEMERLAGEKAGTGHKPSGRQDMLTNDVAHAIEVLKRAGYVVLRV